MSLRLEITCSQFCDFLVLLFRFGFVYSLAHKKSFASAPHPDSTRLRRSPRVPPTSGAGVEPEEIGCKAETGVRLSESEGISDLNRTWPSGPSLNHNRKFREPGSTWNFQPPDRCRRHRLPIAETLDYGRFGLKLAGGCAQK